ncbi:hypothetical protein PVK06_035618 [Gossypium arboreum]|uniref:Uncharacterized protein n=1 Tax=Gossypium arboreum TaxID=29729 RepID=A0ABR0NHQ9_GOSAR|nr:hypothetical protein PVK06_035618 [Gossypium arboreum]
MSFSPSPPPPPIFTGENYHIRVVKIKTYLQAHDLWNMLINALYEREERRANRLKEYPERAFQAKTIESLGSSYKGKKPWLDKREKPKRDDEKKRFPPCIHCKKSTYLKRYYWYRPDIQCRSCKHFGHIEKVYKNKKRAQTQQ